MELRVTLSNLRIDPNMIECIIDAYERWNDFLRHKVPADIWLNIFQKSLSGRSREISKIAQVCKHWNDIVRKNATQLIHVHLSCNLTSNWHHTALWSLIKFNSEKLKDFESFWGFVIDDTAKHFNNITKENEVAAMIVENGTIILGQAAKIGNKYSILTSSVMFAKLFNDRLYSGKVTTMYLPVDGYDIEKTSDAIIIKLKK